MRFEQITRVCCLGTGIMGFGTALLFALHGYSVNMFGRSRASLDRAFANIGDALDLYRAHDLITDEDIRRTLGAITGCTSYAEAVGGSAVPPCLRNASHFAAASLPRRLRSRRQKLAFLV